jgi:hypothetical protein
MECLAHSDTPPPARLCAVEHRGVVRPAACPDTRVRRNTQSGRLAGAAYQSDSGTSLGRAGSS